MEIRANKLNEYEVGQKVWFIKTFDNYNKPAVESAIVTRKTVTMAAKHMSVQLEYRDSAGTYRTAPYIPIYRTKKDAGKDLKKVYKEQLVRIAKLYEESVKTLGAEIQTRQRELETYGEALAGCQKRLEGLK